MFWSQLGAKPFQFCNFPVDTWRMSRGKESLSILLSRKFFNKFLLKVRSYRKGSTCLPGRCTRGMSNTTVPGAFQSISGCQLALRWSAHERAHLGKRGEDDWKCFIIDLFLRWGRGTIFWILLLSDQQVNPLLKRDLKILLSHFQVLVQTHVLRANVSLLDLTLMLFSKDRYIKFHIMKMEERLMKMWFQGLPWWSSG